MRLILIVLITIIIGVLSITKVFSQGTCISDARNDIRCMNGKQTPNHVMPYTSGFPDPAGKRIPNASPPPFGSPAPKASSAPTLRATPPPSTRK